MNELPPAELLSPERAGALLELMFDLPAQTPELAQQVVEAVRSVRSVRGGWRAQWEIGEHRISFCGHMDEVLSPSQLVCTCYGGRSCVHICALLLVMAWNLQEGRPYFSLPVWEIRLASLVGAPSMGRSAPIEADNRHEGWIRYHIEPAREADAQQRLYAWRVRRSIIRKARRGERELQAQACPESWEAIEGRVNGPGAPDRAFHALWAEYEELCQLYAARWQAISARGQHILCELADRMMLALAEVSDLRLGEQPVRMARARVQPRLRAEASELGLQLAWTLPVKARIDIGSGFILDDQQVLHPLQREVPPRLRELMGRPLPQVPREDVPRLVERFVMGAGLPIEIPISPELGVVEADEREARLQLREDGRDLLVEARFAYRLEDRVTEVAAEDPAAMLAVAVDEGGERVWIRRDFDGEQAEMLQLRALFPEGLPARFTGDAALDFLALRLPELARRVPVFGQDRLIANRLRGVLQPRVQVPAGLDWFDLRVNFEIGEQSVSARTLLESWLAGRPFLRLPDGALARLPEAWLTRHGRTLAELEDIRRVSPRGLGAHTLPLAEALLADAEGDTGPWTTLAGRMQHLAELPDRALPLGLRASLRPYQILGFRWLCWLRELGVGGCLADDMGLGKTVQTLAWLLDGGGPSLVIAPTSVVENWVREARRFAPGLRVYAHRGSRRNVDFSSYDLVITSYGMLRADGERLASIVWRHLVLDEAQQIRNPASQSFRAACAISADHRLALTGTPMENRLLELWSVLQFLNPGFFGSRASFVRRYAGPVERHQDEGVLVELRRRIRPFVLRRLKREVATELPERQEQTLWCDLGPEQRALYDRVRLTARDTVLRAMQERDGANQLHVLEVLTRLRQACCDPALLPFAEARQAVGSAKLDVLMEALDEAMADGHRSLIFSQWPSLLERVASRLRERAIDFLLLTGATRERAALVDRFQAEGGPPVFLISLKAGGTGLNLTSADFVFHLDPWWNPAAEDQATDRAHRIGQLRPVMVYRLVARDTVEDRILALQKKKRALFASTLDEERLRAEDLGQEELQIVLDAVEALASAEST